LDKKRTREKGVGVKGRRGDVSDRLVSPIRIGIHHLREVDPSVVDTHRQWIRVPLSGKRCSENIAGVWTRNQSLRKVRKKKILLCGKKGWASSCVEWVVGRHGKKAGARINRYARLAPSRGDGELDGA